MMLNFAESGHPVFQATSALAEENFKKAKVVERRLFTATEAKKPLN